MFSPSQHLMLVRMCPIIPSEAMFCNSTTSGTQPGVFSGLILPNQISYSSLLSMTLNYAVSFTYFLQNSLALGAIKQIKLLASILQQLRKDIISTLVSLMCGYPRTYSPPPNKVSASCYSPQIALHFLMTPVYKIMHSLEIASNLSLSSRVSYVF